MPLRNPKQIAAAFFKSLTKTQEKVAAFKIIIKINNNIIFPNLRTI
jgi:hypothetical protein